MDHFFKISTLSRGYIAIECSEEGLGHAEALVCAYLLNKHRFSASEALAWIQIMHPPRSGGERADSREVKLFKTEYRASACESSQRGLNDGCASVTRRASASEALAGEGGAEGGRCSAGSPAVGVLQTSTGRTQPSFCALKVDWDSAALQHAGSEPDSKASAKHPQMWGLGPPRASSHPNLSELGMTSPHE